MTQWPPTCSKTLLSSLLGQCALLHSSAVAFAAHAADAGDLKSLQHFSGHINSITFYVLGPTGAQQTIKEYSENSILTKTQH